MKPPPCHLVAAITAIAGGLVMVRQVAGEVLSARHGAFPGIAAQSVCMLIAIVTWTLLFAGALCLLLRIPKSWHVAARASAMLAIACVLLSAGSLVLLVPYFALHTLCIPARLCEFSLFAEQ